MKLIRVESSERVVIPTYDKNKYSGIDLSTIDNGRLIHHSQAEDVDAQSLNIGEINIPVSFKVLDSGHFRMNGLMENSKDGVVVSGVVSNELAKINHINVESLKDYAREHGNPRIGEALITELEQRFKNIGVKKVYVVFYGLKTVSFFLRNGYEILSPQSLTEEQKNNLDTLDVNINDLDQTITNQEDFTKLMEMQESDNKHMLLTKHIV
ncbi:MAG: hypothetical protein NTW98_02100 [Candidatus Nomurabacteria bacterium]|nr:hypothetical protein [Candidatus Nomurabacteria bacterium]